MRKAFVLFLTIAILGIVLGSCGARQVVSYCPFCGRFNIKEVSTYDTETGFTELYYECQNSKCGRSFGAGQIL